MFGRWRFVLRPARLVRLRPVTAYDAPCTLSHGETKYDFMIHNANLGFTLWTVQTKPPLFF